MKGYLIKSKMMNQQTTDDGCESIDRSTDPRGCNFSLHLLSPFREKTRTRSSAVLTVPFRCSLGISCPGAFVLPHSRAFALFAQRALLAPAAGYPLSLSSLALVFFVCRVLPRALPRRTRHPHPHPHTHTALTNRSIPNLHAHTIRNSRRALATHPTLGARMPPRPSKTG